MVEKKPIPCISVVIDHKGYNLLFYKGTFAVEKNQCFSSPVYLPISKKPPLISECFY